MPLVEFNLLQATNTKPLTSLAALTRYFTLNSWRATAFLLGITTFDLQSFVESFILNQKFYTKSMCASQFMFCETSKLPIIKPCKSLGFITSIFHILKKKLVTTVSVWTPYQPSASHSSEEYLVVKKCSKKWEICKPECSTTWKNLYIHAPRHSFVPYIFSTRLLLGLL